MRSPRIRLTSWLGLAAVTACGGKSAQSVPAAQFSKVFKVPGGQDVSPQLSWSGFPAATTS